MWAWFLSLAAAGAVGVGGMSVEEGTRARSLDVVIVELLRGYLRLHQQEQHLQEHYVGSYLANHLDRVSRYVGEYDNFLAGCDNGRLDAAAGRRVADGEDPLLGFLVTRRLVRDWHSLREASLGDSWQVLVRAVWAAEEALGLTPRLYHHVAKADSLMRLHHVYRLDALHVAHGSPALRASDVAGVGVAALEDGMYGRAADWFAAAHDRWEKRANGTKSQDDRRRQQLDILLHLATAAHDYKLSKEGFANQAGIYPRPLTQVRLGELKGRSPDPKQEEGVRPNWTPDSIPTTPEDSVVYSRLCRGHSFLSAREASRLKCRLDARGSGWLTLMPAKVEEHSLDPPILSFHEVLSQRQLAVLRQLALPLVEQARVQIRDEGAQGSPALRHRSSYTTWLPARVHPALRAASRMVAALTGLEVSEELGEAEMLQVNQYGTGGHYDPHMDFLALYRRIWEAKEPELQLLEQHPNGDRIATFMFYVAYSQMNDVEEGGRTVFPRVGVGVGPRRGSAVFWWNLLPSGRGDARMLHAACPVLRGTKWVSNKWIKSHPQLHHRPCLPQA